ncbi:MAG TPA: PepSY domain-containing protein [Euzebyales bacterium]|nr:PepSY domain-containing protein [Euzebyales bacterium]
MSKQTIIVAVVAALALIGGGIALAAGPGEPSTPDAITLARSADLRPTQGPSPSGDATPGDQPTPGGDVTPDGDDDGGSVATRDGDVDQAAAERAALDAVGGGEVIAVEREADDDDEWEVHVDHDGRVHEVDVARDGQVVGLDVDDDDDRRASTATPRIGEEQAGRIARDAVGGGTVRGAHLDADDSGDEWEVVVIDGADRWIEVVVDAADGRVLELDVED